ncbi:MAG: peptide-methionine (S)-S-oxide reductase MsrA [Tepidisphaeraceae bacterium]
MAASTIGIACSRGDVDPKTFPNPSHDLAVKADDTAPRTAVLAGGCFWCTEGVFEHIPGVTDVESGYAGDTKETADYKTVCTGTTNHAEVIRITYDPQKVSYGQLLKAFFAIAHDPTTLNRQGNDVGRQYRSAVFYANEDERLVAADYIKQLDDAKVFASPIVTTLEPLKEFFPAELYHQNYVQNNPDQPYIAGVAMPKVAKALKYAKSLQSSTQPTTQP